MTVLTDRNGADDMSSSPAVYRPKRQNDDCDFDRLSHCYNDQVRVYLTSSLALKRRQTALTTSTQTHSQTLA